MRGCCNYYCSFKKHGGLEVQFDVLKNYAKSGATWFFKWKFGFKPTLGKLVKIHLGPKLGPKIIF